MNYEDLVVLEEVLLGAEIYTENYLKEEHMDNEDLNHPKSTWTKD